MCVNYHKDSSLFCFAIKEHICTFEEQINKHKMKASDLRVGNLIYWNIPEKENIIHVVAGIRNKTPQTTPISLGESIDDYKPIQLTEEWLVRFGFNKEEIQISKGHGFFYSMNYMDYKYSFSFAEFRGDWGFYHSYTDATDDKDNNRFDFISCGIKYVHQLQNLFYALTNTELQLKISSHLLT